MPLIFYGRSVCGMAQPQPCYKLVQHALALVCLLPQLWILKSPNSLHQEEEPSLLLLIFLGVCVEISRAI